MKYWLLKTEPSVFSIDDLESVGTEPWDGIRNYQARNFMRDDMDVGDRVFIYHSREQPIGIVGEGEVASNAYPDPTQFKEGHTYYDPKSSRQQPRWILRDIRYVRHYPRILSLAELKQTPGLEEMMVVRKGMRLSIQPVTETEWQHIQQMVKSDQATKG